MMKMIISYIKIYIHIIYDNKRINTIYSNYLSTPKALPTHRTSITQLENTLQGIDVSNTTYHQHD